MKYKALILGGTLAVLAWGAGLAGFFRTPNSLLYDVHGRLAPVRSTVEEKILLVEIDPSSPTFSVLSWESLVSVLMDLKASQVVLSFIPASVSDGFKKIAENNPRLVFGRKVFSLPDEGSERWRLEKLPDWARQANLEYGLIVAPPAYRGIVRSQFTHFTIDGKTIACLEYAAWSLTSSGRKLSPPNPFLINFNASGREMATVSVERVLAGDLVEELTGGRSVLVGLKKPAYEVGIHTPVSPDKGMSRLEFQGHVLDTLIREKAIIPVSPWISFLLISATVFLVLALFQILPFGIFAWLIVFMGIIHLAFSWTLFSYARVWIPLSEILLTHALLSAILCFHKIEHQEKAVQNMAFKTSVQVRRRILPESFHDTDEQWNLVVTMVSQTLDLNRSIFLEAFAGERHVREVKALNCSLTDISERRRDYTRTPYQTAILEKGPIRIEKHDFLKTNPADNEKEEQYLVPLLFGDRVMGFWGFGIFPQTREKIGRFDALIAEFANQIGELLYQSSRKRTEDSAEHEGLTRFLRMEVKDRQFDHLEHSFSLLGRRLAFLESVFDSLDTAIALFDIFGQVLYSNRRMIALLKSSSLSPFEMTPADLMVVLTGQPLEKVRGMLRFFIFERKPISLPASVPGNPERSYLMNLRQPMEREGTETAIERYPFESSGILVELVDITDLRRMSRLREELVDNITYNLRRDFEPIALAGSLLEEERLPPDARGRILTILKKRIDNMILFIANAKKDLNKEVFFDSGESFPVDPKGPLAAAVEQTRPRALARAVSLDLGMPRAVSMICVNPDLFLDILTIVLEILVHDAVENTSVSVNLIETDEGILLTLSNQGFGMPDETFQRFLNDKDAMPTPEFKNLARAVRQLEKWGASIRAKSEVGTGIHFTIGFEPGLCHLGEE